MQYCNNELIENNMRLVYYEFNKLHKTQLTIKYKEDLISEGMLGLVKAAKTFDENKGNKFSTYAAMCIRNQMLLFIRKVNKYIGEEVSLFTPINEDGDESNLCLADVLVDTATSMDSALTLVEVSDVVNKLKPKEQKLLRLHQDGYKQKEIAVKQSLSQSYISRILRNIKIKMTETLK